MVLDTPFHVDQAKVFELVPKISSLIDIALTRRACLTLILNPTAEGGVSLKSDLHHRRRKSYGPNIDSGLDAMIKELSWTPPKFSCDAESVAELLLRAAHHKLNLTFKADFRLKGGKLFQAMCTGGQGGSYKSARSRQADATAALVEVLQPFGALA